MRQSSCAFHSKSFIVPLFFVVRIRKRRIRSTPATKKLLRLLNNFFQTLVQKGGKSSFGIEAGEGKKS